MRSFILSANVRFSRDLSWDRSFSESPAVAKASHSFRICLLRANASVPRSVKYNVRERPSLSLRRCSMNPSFVS